MAKERKMRKTMKRILKERVTRRTIKIKMEKI
jgi:hypothetical protein